MRSKKKYITILALTILLLLSSSNTLIQLIPKMVNTTTSTMKNNSLIFEQNAASDLYILSRAFVVQYTPQSLIDDYSFLLTLPLSLFYSGENLHVSPVFFSEQTPYQQYFIDDLKQFFLSEHKEISEVIYIGNNTIDTYQYFSTQFKNAKIKQFGTEDLFQLATQLALYDWKYSEYAVIAPIDINLSNVTQTTNTYSLHFDEVSNKILIRLGNISNDEKKIVSLNFNSDYGLAMGTLDWEDRTTNLLTYEFFDPDGNIVDYATKFYSNLQHKYFGNKLKIWTPIHSGMWNFSIYGASVYNTENYNLTLSLYPCIQKEITIPENTLEVEITLTWDDILQNVDLFLLDENNTFITANYTVAEESLTPEEKLILHNPPAGNYKVVAVLRDGDGDLDLELQVDVKQYDKETLNTLLSASNAAVISSIMNAPLFYTDYNMITESTIAALKILGVSHIIIVDMSNVLQNNIIDTLQNEGFSIDVTLKSIKTVSKYIRQIGNDTDIVFSVPYGYGDELVSASAMLAAYHKAPILWAPSDVILWSESNWYEHNRPLEGEDAWEVDFNNYDGNYDDRIPNRYKMWYLADLFSKFMKKYNLDMNNTEESIITVADLIRFKATFERAIIGDFIPGRIPATNPLQALIFSERTVLYAPLMNSNSKHNVALLSLIAYSEGAQFIKNDGSLEYIYERISLPNAFTSNNYNVELHTGYQQIFSLLDDGILLWDVSTHGVVVNTQADRYLDPNWLFILLLKHDYDYTIENGGTPSDPDANDDQIVEPQDSTDFYYLREDTFQSSIDNLHGVVSVFSACQVGATNYANLFFIHGGTAIVAALRSIYFDGAGWINVAYSSYIASGMPLGLALKSALSWSSEIYSQHYYTAASDYSLAIVVFGDPELILFSEDQDVNPPENPLRINADGHTPSHATTEIAVINVTPELSDYFLLHAYSFDNYNLLNNSVLEAFKLKLFNYRTVIFTDQANYSRITSELADNLASYVYHGGRLIMYGVPDGEFNITNMEFIVTSASISDADLKLLSDHPLAENLSALPNTYSAFFSSFSQRYFVILSASDHPVWIEGTYGIGKITVLTFNLNNLTTILDRIFSWLDLSIIIVDILEKPSHVVQTYSANIKLQVLSFAGDIIENASVYLMLNDEKIFANETTAGVYELSFDVPDNLLGDVTLEIFIFKDGVNPRKVLLKIFIEERPWYFKYKRIIVPILLIALILISLYITRPKKKPVMIRIKNEPTYLLVKNPLVPF